MKARLLCLLAWLPLSAPAAAPALPQFNFAQPTVAAEWRAAHHIAGLRATTEGLEISISGDDPYLYGPVRDYPTNTPLWLHLRVNSEQGGHGQVFYFRDHAREENSVHFSVKRGVWSDVRVMVPALGPGYRLRLDPPGRGRKTTIASLGFTAATPLTPPVWPKLAPLSLAKAHPVKSGGLEVQVAEQGFAIQVAGRPMAVSHTRPMIGYTLGETLRWLELSSPAAIEAKAGTVVTRLSVKDPDGATWQISRSFAPNVVSGAVDVETTVQVDQERAVVFLPLLLLTAGQGTFAPAKGQALFPGLEYLDNEPSSSEADIVGPESKRQVPANHKITFPLMVVQAENRYVGIIWNHAAQFSALFDSPDRLLQTGGHLMGVLFPGSDGFDRIEGSLLPTKPTTLAASKPLRLMAHIIGGDGESVVPAIQHYVRLRGLPAPPEPGKSFPDFVSLFSHGWLDSKIRETNLYRHAVWQGFSPQPAADPALYMQWLAGQTTDTHLRQRLLDAAQGALSLVNPAHVDSALVGHVRYPVQSLLFGHVPEVAERHGTHAQALLRRFNPDGTITYKPGSTDYGRTHYTNHANGLSAQVAAAMLESATFSGDSAVIDQALGKIRSMKRAYANSVPRGAQTWEVPLHTPDNMASAHLVRAFTLAYQITGDPEMLDEAVYWAWTGLPFFYLVNPVGFSDPPYGSITVYGATSWKAPIWMGRPVQWCGLVYADALYRLAPYHPTGPWKQLADGITAMGVRYTWPLDDQERQGLLPDVWELLVSERAGPAINPGTVQANAVRLFGKGPLYDCRVFLQPGQRIIVHAPGEIVPVGNQGGKLQFTVRAWPQEPYYILVTGLTKPPQVRLGEAQLSLSTPNQFQEKEGRLILQLKGQSSVQIAFPSSN